MDNDSSGEFNVVYVVYIQYKFYLKINSSLPTYATTFFPTLQDMEGFGVRIEDPNPSGRHIREKSELYFSMSGGAYGTAQCTNKERLAFNRNLRVATSGSFHRVSREIFRKHEYYGSTGTSFRSFLFCRGIWGGSMIEWGSRKISASGVCDYIDDDANRSKHKTN
jgi:hypothetical protein